MKKLDFLFLFFVIIFFMASTHGQKKDKLFKQNAHVEMAGTGFLFTEGPAVAKNGNVYFTDQPNDKIHIWDEKKGVSLYLQGTGRSNGMYFNSKGQLVACADENNQLVYFDENKKMNVIFQDFEGKHLNAPNDLWIAPNETIYFTDPYYHRTYWAEDHKQIQDVQGVYSLDSEGHIKLVISDFVKPNGIIGTPDGKTLYVADNGDNKIWKYDITEDGTLANKTFFAPHGSDGMTIDAKGNIYLTSGKVWVYNAKGALISEIEVPEKPSNVCFAGKKRNILFITARKSIYTLKMQVKGVN
ncbi:SMP-30/gluconolactonase/LRE family protein [Mariniflexile gromovii]|uniref:SMP-30/gluconolactonase/LRE family protein n=1 Tax=Mariniflexile gromovii TaxID=362523 RepID=A0ABS4BXK9_9FLAO|nr:SMP-30/gluconolactonase/LRE family protein [Mariniflexile gromovii]MBP0905328.1 SMP-30/gluconolactonase/LRE family protein [Mariniflexile gromovii]